MPVATAQLSLNEFAPLVGESFTLRVNTGSDVPLRLSTVKPLGWNTPPEAGGRQSFSLLFHAPAETTIVQGIHAFTHPLLGTHSLFLVPVSRNTQGLGLEVIFNFA